MVRSYRFSLPSSSRVGWCGFVYVRIRPRETSARVASIVPRARFSFFVFLGRSGKKNNPSSKFFSEKCGRRGFKPRSRARGAKVESIHQREFRIIRAFIRRKLQTRGAMCARMKPHAGMVSFLFFVLRAIFEQSKRQGFRKTHVFILWQQW